MVTAVGAAVVYAGSQYVKKAMKHPDGYKAFFNYRKFSATLILGIIIGLFFAYYEIPVTEEALEIQFIAFAGLIPIIENVLKTFWRALETKDQKKIEKVAAEVFKIARVLGSSDNTTVNYTVEE